MGKNVAVLGCGNMGTAIVKGLLESEWTEAGRITITSPDTERLATLAAGMGVQSSEDNAAAVKGADVILLCVKPQILPDVLREIQSSITSDKLLISIAAGVAIDTIEAYGGEAPVIRSMPNLAVTVGMGATAISPGTHATKADLEMAREIFESVGIVELVPEYLLDAVTGLSGTGPLYLFYLIEALSDAGVKVGLSRAVATRLAMQTVKGSAELALVSGMHPAELKDMVSSPGGTSITALHVLQKQGFAATMMDAVEAATKRSQELGQ